MKCLLVGAGYMAKEYARVLDALNVAFDVVGRGVESARNFETTTGHKVYSGGLQHFWKKERQFEYDCAIVATNVETLYENTMTLIENGVQRLLVEKPGGLNSFEVGRLDNMARQKNASVFIAYNRRFYSSVKEAKKLIAEDGGVSSFCFEFTELGYKIQDLKKAQSALDHWFIANSTHVVDLAFYLGGEPVDLNCIHQSEEKWHEHRFSGCGRSDKGAVFSYFADWMAPGRWGVEVLTAKHRLILRPLERLSVQHIGSFETEPWNIDDSLDVGFKPGLFNQTKTFIEGSDDTSLLPLEQHVRMMKTYEQMLQMGSVNTSSEVKRTANV